MALGDRTDGVTAKGAAIYLVLILKYAYAVFGKALYARQMPRLRCLHNWLVQEAEDTRSQIGKFVIFRLSLKVFQLNQFFFERAYLLGERQSFLLTGKRDIVGSHEFGVHLRDCGNKLVEVGKALGGLDEFERGSGAGDR